ncbi:MAG: DNA primase [Euryarchaeota archaeon]|jgi:DNA primase|nr:DNA primase [Euryarchaeota archaeon]MBT7244052.1 DNA primase [Euryarchaeota archaeon]
MGRKNNTGGSKGGSGKSNKAMKYLIKADLKVNGNVQRKDIIGAIMGQTEGLLGDELELRKLQRTARIGHVDVEVKSSGGKVNGEILIPSSMDNVETAIIASSLETIDRIGPCAAKITVREIQDVRSTKVNAVIDRAKDLLLVMVNSGDAATKTVIEEVRSVLTVGTAKNFHGLTCGPNVETSDSLIIVEGRNDVRNLLNFGVKNAISCDGAGTIKQELLDLAATKENVILAIDGDRGGEMLFRQLNETMKIDFVAQAPVGQEWELLPQKTATKCLSQKMETAKFAAKLPEDEPSEDADAWLEDAPAEEQAEAPAEVHEYFDHIADLKANNAVFVNVDGTVSDAVGPSKLAAAAEDADGAVAIVFNGAVSDRILDIASEAAIETVVGTKEGKGFAARDDVKAWLTEKHA